MAIPKVIYQTYSHKTDIPWKARYHIWNMRRINPEYDYRFYNDEDVDKFIYKEFGADVYKQYSRITIGAAKADFFRYAILFKKGGIYMDIDSMTSSKFSSWIKNDDRAIITKERNPGFYVQWALVYEKGHPFLEKVLDAVIDNIRTDKYPNDVHKMTGPTVYRQVLNSCLNENSSHLYREFGVDFEGKIKFKYWLSGLSFRRKEHWRQSQKKRPILTKE